MKNRCIVVLLILVGLLMMSTLNAYAAKGKLIFKEDFDSGSLDQSIWTINVGDGYLSEISFIDDGRGGKMIKLYGDGYPAWIRLDKNIAPPYVLEFDTIQPSDATGPYSSVVFQESGLTGRYYYVQIHLGPGEWEGVFSIWTQSEEKGWDIGWVSSYDDRFDTDTLYRVRIENRETDVRITILSPDGEELAASDWVPHVIGFGMPIVFGAWADNGERSIIFDNIEIWEYVD